MFEKTQLVLIHKNYKIKCAMKRGKLSNGAGSKNKTFVHFGPVLHVEESNIDVHYKEGGGSENQLSLSQ